MTCPYSFKMALPSGGVANVPCGKCILCKIQRSREWCQRLLKELETKDWEGLFVTLTYNEENCPDELKKKDLQKYIKRVRKDIGERKIKYYACGEYGEKHKRPHYHLIMLGMWIDDIEIIKENWPFGFVKIGSVTYDSCRYVADYIQKKNVDDVVIGKAHPFQLQSQGIGKDFMIKNIDTILNDKGLIVNGRPAGFNRYFVKMIRTKYPEYEERLIDVLIDKKQEQRAKELERYGFKSESFEDERHKAKVQKLKNVLAKTALQSKKM